MVTGVNCLNRNIVRAVEENEVSHQTSTNTYGITETPKNFQTLDIHFAPEKSPPRPDSSAGPPSSWPPEQKPALYGGALCLQKSATCSVIQNSCVLPFPNSRLCPFTDSN